MALPAKFPLWMRTIDAGADGIYAAVTILLRQYANIPVGRRPSYREFASEVNSVYGTTLTRESIRDFLSHERRRAGTIQHRV